ncbi:LysR family transcriptional regulator [Ornithinibacillus sp. 4-3]|uniref:LysR family transcriptional regulator n=1 Tax=Ornithinibacillus sp. 4-3 TaxID=3231488 RepID=A0AB39HNI1_9BACI
MDIRQLKYFDSLVRNKKFTKAAEELFISQPSLTNMIKKLEKELGFKLFERTTREISLTESGELFYKHTQNIMQVYDLTLKEMEEIKFVGKGKITIAVLESSNFWLPKVIKTFAEKYRELKINFKNIIFWEDVEKALLNYDIHFAITNHQTNNPNLVHYELYQDELIILLPETHHLSKKRAVAFNDLKDEIFINFSKGFQIREDFLKLCLEAGFNPKSIYEVNDFDAVCSLVENELGIALMPESYFKYAPQKLEKLSYTRIKDPTPTRSVYISFHKQRYLTPATHDLITLVKKFFE